MTTTNSPRVVSTHEPPLWEHDKGTLTYHSRRALVQLLQGPLIRAQKEPVLWSAIISDEENLRARLHEVFLELVIDETEGFAFTRMVEEDSLSIPQVLRTDKLKHIDTAILLNLRQELGLALPGERVIVDVEDLRESIGYVRAVDNRDEAGFTKRFNAAIKRIQNDYSLLSTTETEGRLEVSPVLRQLFDASTVTAIRDEYARLARAEDTEEDTSDE
ncbi:DUF4194 domain-containing protein [Corynebacterium striatum]|uniref:DUF4194 domain-containing protein n=1 Tax=Corynebacterium striatum TaxID=43770 RepID=UPI001661FFDF|nr:DUF4194 domain-containing protein [Corynebacterium striatum]MBD0854077.1 hypothetical protein [Corynebacterium striatum]MDK8844739.1 DUF4194 domain-containing protein [Corynebacterium striatum]